MGHVEGVGSSISDNNLQHLPKLLGGAGKKGSADSVGEHGGIVAVIRLEKEVVFSSKGDVGRNIGKGCGGGHFHFHSEGENVFFEFGGTKLGGQMGRENMERGVVGQGKEGPPADSLVTGKGEGDDCLSFRFDLCADKEKAHSLQEIQNGKSIANTIEGGRMGVTESAGGDNREGIFGVHGGKLGEEVGNFKGNEWVQCVQQ